MSNTLYKFHPCYDTRTPSLVQKYQLCASERQDTKGADLRTERGAKVANCWGAGSAGVCLCFAGLLLLGFCFPCFCHPLLWVLAVPACLSPQFLYV